MGFLGCSPRSGAAPDLGTLAPPRSGAGSPQTQIWAQPGGGDPQANRPKKCCNLPTNFSPFDHPQQLCPPLLTGWLEKSAAKLDRAHHLQKFFPTRGQKPIWAQIWVPFERITQLGAPDLGHSRTCPSWVGRPKKGVIWVWVWAQTSPNPVTQGSAFDFWQS